MQIQTRTVNKKETAPNSENNPNFQNKKNKKRRQSFVDSF